MGWNPFGGPDPKDLFLQFTPLDTKWRVVTWNFELEYNVLKEWTVEAHKTHKEVIKWTEGKKATELRFYQDDRIQRKRKISSAALELADLMNLSLHSTLKYSLDLNHPFMLEPVSGATTLDFQNEARALQWIQVSFGAVMKALDRLEQDSSLVLTAAFFSGVVPDTGENILRLIAFNLDIFFYMREDSSLQIVVFNDKDMGHGGSKTPSFQQIIKVTKPQFYDEITKLTHRLAQVGEIK